MKPGFTICFVYKCTIIFTTQERLSRYDTGLPKHRHDLAGHLQLLDLLRQCYGDGLEELRHAHIQSCKILVLTLLTQNPD